MRADLRGERGVTLMEVAIVLVATIVIIGVLAPTLSAVVRHAETTAATNAMTDIATQINTMIGTDLALAGYSYFTINGTALGTQVQMLVSDGDTPVQCTAAAAACTAWQRAVDNTGGLVDFLERHLVTNNPRGSSANDYPDTEVLPDVYWRGAYLTSPIDPDPWGNRYAVNVQYLGLSTNDVDVLSAGPDEEIDTAYTANPLNAGGDDLIVLVQS
jgi:hypothetical protein